MIHTINHHTAYSYSKFTCRNPSRNVIKLKKNTLRNHGRQSGIAQDTSGVQIATPPGKLSQKQSSSAPRYLCGHDGHAYNFFKAKPLLCWRSDLAFFNLRYYFLNTLKALHLCWSASRNNKRVAFVGANGNLLDIADLQSYGHHFRNKGLTRDVLPRLKRTAHVSLHGSKKKVSKGIFGGPRLKPKKATLNSKPKTLKTHHLAHDLLPLRSLSRILQACASHAGYIKKHSAYDLVPVSGKKSDGSQIQTRASYILQGKIGLAGARRQALLYNDTSTSFFSNSELSCPGLWNHFLALAYAKSTPRTCHWAVRRHAFGFQTYNLRLPLDGIVPHVGQTYLFKKKLSDFQSRKNLFLGGRNKKKRSVYINRYYRNLCIQAMFKLCFGSSLDTKEILAVTKTQNKNQSFKFLLKKKHTRTQPNLDRRHEFKKTVLHNIHRHGSQHMDGVKNRKASVYGQSPDSVRHLRGSLYQLRSIAANRVCGRHLYKNYVASRRKFKKRKYYVRFLQHSYHHDFKKFATNSNLKQVDVIFFTHPDKTAALASQARRLRLPSIGLVSGLKPQHGLKHKGGDVQKDSVDTPILGNPNDSFFVFMILRMFLNVINHASMYKPKITKVNHHDIHTKIATPTTKARQVATSKTPQADKSHLKGEVLDSAVPQRVKTYRGANQKQSRGANQKHGRDANQKGLGGRRSYIQKHTHGANLL